MRPFELDNLFRPLTSLAGVGPRNGKYLERLVGGPKILDLLFHKPVDFIDRSFAPKISEAPHGKIATLTVTIDKHIPSARRHLPYRVQCSDDTGTITLIFFHARKDWLEKQLPVGQKRIISGKIEHYQGAPQMPHPDAMVTEANKDDIPSMEPIYPLTQGITNNTLRKSIKSALKDIPSLPEWQNKDYLKQQKWRSWKDSLLAVHKPADESALMPEHLSRERLAYDEFLANQLTLALVRHRQQRIQGRSFAGDQSLRKKLLDALPFDLTRAQEKALGEIYKDMGEPLRMLRLLQGDVGSGKTVVAALAMLASVETGAQAALMAPTEILARQHAESLAPWLEAAGVKIAILTGRDKGKNREAILKKIANGEAQIVIGTHALFQDSVEFKDLGLAVVDEQHRFGVHQRLQLSSKGSGVDILVMTATPIPRTLTLTAYGDMDVSRLDEKPPGRKPIDTLLISQDKTENMIEGLQRQIKDGARIYWVCPLVEESEFMDAAAAQERYEILEAKFGSRVGLVHGRMKPEEKDEVMKRFVCGEIDILVATTVIEVGVNVPEATIMVIEHAERFGLSQLHQLRGRVGRGSDKSYCFLIYKGPLGETAKERLSIMRATEDGFVIAEKDLELRGSGEILGTKQSGLPAFKLASLPAHTELLQAARDDARLIIQKDPDLETERGKALRTLLYLFERDQAIQYFRSG